MIYDYMYYTIPCLAASISWTRTSWGGGGQQRGVLTERAPWTPRPCPCHELPLHLLLVGPDHRVHRPSLSAARKTGAVSLAETSPMPPAAGNGRRALSAPRTIDPLSPAPHTERTLRVSLEASRLRQMMMDECPLSRPFICVRRGNSTTCALH
jgi:hypothetical protein